MLRRFSSLTLLALAFVNSCAVALSNPAGTMVISLPPPVYTVNVLNASACKQVIVRQGGEYKGKAKPGQVVRFRVVLAPGQRQFTVLAIGADEHSVLLGSGELTVDYQFSQGVIQELTWRITYLPGKSGTAGC